MDSRRTKASVKVTDVDGFGEHICSWREQKRSKTEEQKFKQSKGDQGPEQLQRGSGEATDVEMAGVLRKACRGLPPVVCRAVRICCVAVKGSQTSGGRRPRLRKGGSGF